MLCIRKPPLAVLMLELCMIIAKAKKRISFWWESQSEILWSALHQELRQTARLELEQSRDKLSLPQPQADG